MAVVGGDIATLPPDEPSSGPTKAPAKTPTPPSFKLLITDENNLHPAGIPVILSGPVTKTFTSDETGTASGNVPAGFYNVKIPQGCQSDVIVNKGGTAKIGVVQGNTVEGSLLVIWQHRFGPAPPVDRNMIGDWTVGSPVVVSYSIEDHCAQTKAKNRGFPTYEYLLSSTVKLASKPVLESDGGGVAHVSVVCVHSGEISLDVRDRADPTDRIDLLQLAIGEDRVPRCIN